LTQLLLIRHAESIGNQAGIMQGQGNYELSAKGQQQAQALGQRLAQEGKRPTHLYSSPLMRGRQTLAILLACLQECSVQLQDLPLCCVDRRLQEIDNGILSGLTWQQAKRQYPELCQALERSPDWIPISGAESPQTCYDRAQAFIQDLLANHQQSQRIWVMTHGGILPYLVAALLGSDRVWGFQSEPTALFEFVWDHDRWELNDQNLNLFNTTLWKIQRFNDSNHLRALT
jgi:2,3-bisphosphoglycerate-dependent phosphoglycerate mutase